MANKDNPLGGLFLKKKSDSASPLPQSKKKNVSRRWMYVGLGIVGLVVISSSIFGTKPPAPPPAKVQDQGSVEVTPPQAAQQSFENQYGQQLQSIKQQLQQLQQDNKDKSELIKKLQSQPPVAAAPLPAGVVPPPLPPGSAPTYPQGLPPLSGMSPSAPPLAPAAGTPPPVALPPPVAVPSAPLAFPAPPVASGSKAQGLPNVKANVTYKANKNAGLLLSGAFAPIALLNGLDAGTAAATQANPMPVLMDVLNQATLPGLAKYRLRNCFILGTGYGDLSAERVYVRFSRLSCVDKSQDLVLSADVSGYLVDSDGKLGLRGTVHDRQGAKLGKAMLAGFAQGLAGALGQAQGSTSSSLTSGLTTSTMTGASALRASGLGGAQVAASQLADFYLKEAQNIFPVISINAGRTGTAVFSSSTSLHWESAKNDFVKDVRPQ